MRMLVKIESWCQLRRTALSVILLHIIAKHKWVHQTFTALSHAFEEYNDVKISLN